MLSGMTFSLKNRSSRKRPLAMSSFRLRLEAARIRASTSTDSEEPTGSHLPSSMTRTSLAWVLRLISPISSRNRVPPSARRNLPFLSL